MFIFRDRFKLLQKIIDTDYTFKIITIEHDAYIGNHFHEQERVPQRELLKSKGSESHMFFSTTAPGVTRGNHFHFNKVERFCILKGTANVSMRKLGTSKVISYIIEETNNTVIDIPILYTHNITNIGDSDLICVFWTNEIFNIEIPDTYYINV